MTDGIPWKQHGDAGGGYPYCTRSLKGPTDHPVWNDGISLYLPYYTPEPANRSCSDDAHLIVHSIYQRLSVEKLWEHIQPPESKITRPELREEAKERFLRRWKKLQEGPNSMAEQQFYNRWSARCEPHLEVKVSADLSPCFTALLTRQLPFQVYFTDGGKKDVLVGSVSVPLTDLQDTFLHDLWLNLHPCTKLPAPRTEAQQRFLDKWVRSEVWGSVHLLIHKSKRENVPATLRSTD